MMNIKMLKNLVEIAIFKGCDIESMWFDIYKVQYHKEIKSNPKAIESLRDIEYMLSNGQDVCLVCICASHVKCHRGIIGGWFEKKGYEVLV